MEYQVRNVVCQIEEEEFAFPVDHITGIEKPQPITKVPNTADYIKGVTNIRGEVTPLLDLRSYLLQKETELDNDYKILLAHVGDIKIGLIVDKANEVMDIPETILETVQVDGEETDQAVQVAKMENRLIILLDIEYMLKEMDEETFGKIRSMI
ncbi:chemotaxis protein CheW [Alteribacillus iranensis]|uniref:Purine-binding chemotaxis protein CheW n=1 Tax=Alteribacillus iranensis TaxID=930128 RepID=A0A1I2DRA9_9BACI|nr:chemotaxis protein CheW [Alteribacillus iranensis]SFE83142.1 purine-binding chemotaxis protein CheW [Alteribacillus iranensis]